MAELGTLPLLGPTAWEDLAIYLSMDDLTVRLIDQKFSTPIKKQKELFRTYLKKCPNPSWKDVLLALIKIGKEEVAKNAVEIFDLPQDILAKVQSTTEVHSLPADSTKGTCEVDFSPVSSDRLSKTELQARLEPFDPAVKLTHRTRVDSDGSAEVAIHRKSLPDKSRTAQFPTRSQPSADASKSQEINVLDDPSFFESLSDHVPRGAKRRVVADGGCSPPDLPCSERIPMDDPSLCNENLSMHSTKPTGEEPRISTDCGRLQSRSAKSAKTLSGQIKSAMNVRNEDIKSQPSTVNEDEHDLHDQRTLTAPKAHQMPIELHYQNEDEQPNASIDRKSNSIEARAEPEIGASHEWPLPSHVHNFNEQTTLGERARPLTDIIHVKTKPRYDEGSRSPLSPSAFHSLSFPLKHVVDEKLTRRESVADGIDADTRSTASSYHSAEEMPVDEVDCDDNALIIHSNLPLRLLGAIMIEDIENVRQCINEDGKLLNQAIQVSFLASSQGSAQLLMLHTIYFVVESCNIGCGLQHALIINFITLHHS